jgi:F1F0 ATPase subunit 2
MILILAFMAGMALGSLFYGGLWITVRRIVTTDHPVAVTLGSLVARTAITLGGFVVATNGRWQNAVACLAGFVVARVVISRLVPACT